MSDAQSSLSSGSTWRFCVLAGLMVIAGSALLFRAVQLHVVDRDFLSKQGDIRSVRDEVLDAHRGTITDRHGKAMAVSAPVATIYADPKKAILDRGDYERLAQVLDIDSAWIKRKIESDRSKRFVYLKRKVAPVIAEQVESLDLNGVYSRAEYKRFYPAGEVAAHVVGFTSIDGQGQEGVELSYEDWLQGSAGKKRVMKDRKGRVIEELGLLEEALPGRDIQLSLDMRLQYLAYRELKAAVTTHRAESGSIVVLDVDSGEVLAMVNQPSYNPNNRSSLKVSHLRNRAVTDVFEPGSTMKLATIATALESGRFTLGTYMDTSPGAIRFGRRSIRDTRNHGRINLTEIVSKSSNVGTSKIALELGGETVWDMFYRLGFGQAVGLGFPGESIGRLPDPMTWKPVKVATMSYGYGMSANALQVAQAYMIFGNGGKKYPLTLIKREEPVEPVQVLTENVSTRLRQVMGAAVHKGGTGTRAQVPLYSVGGKTGTVHRVSKRGYEDSEYQAVFAGVAPLNQPKIALVVVIDAPAGEEYYGGEVAAPVFSRVVSESMRLLGISPDKTAQLKRQVIAENESVRAGDSG